MNTAKQKYIIFSIITYIAVLGPLRSIFLISKGITFSQVMIMTSVYNIIKVFFEIPSGVLGDTMGRKTTLILGTLFKLIFYILLISASNFSLIAIAFMLSGIGDALWVNSKVSYLHDITNQSGDFIKINGLILGVSTALTMIVNVIGGYMYDINKYYPFYMVMVIHIIALILSTLLVNIETVQKKERSTYKEVIKEGSLVIAKNKTLQSLILIGIVSALSIEILKNMKQPYWTFIGLTGAEIGVLGAFLQVSGVIAGLKSEWVYKKLQGGTFKIVLIGYFLVSMFIALIDAKLGFMIYILTPFLSTTMSISLSKHINNELDDKSRTTTLSLYSFVTGILVSVILIGVGYITDKYGIQATSLITAIFTITLGLYSIKIFNKTTKKT